MNVKTEYAYHHWQWVEYAMLDKDDTIESVGMEMTSCSCEGSAVS